MASPGTSLTPVVHCGRGGACLLLALGRLRQEGQELGAMVTNLQQVSIAFLSFSSVQTAGLSLVLPARTLQFLNLALCI